MQVRSNLDPSSLGGFESKIWMFYLKREIWAFQNTATFPKKKYIYVYFFIEYMFL